LTGVNTAQIPLPSQINLNIDSLHYIDPESDLDGPFEPTMMGNGIHKTILPFRFYKMKITGEGCDFPI
jgi:hypothetical protein